MPEIAEESALNALESAFGTTPAPKPVVKAPVPAPVAVDEPMTDEEEALALPDDEEVAETTEVVAEPQLEVELDDGEKQVLTAPKVKELIQKDRDYTKKSEENARTREALTAAIQQHENRQNFQQAAMPDIIELQALDRQLEAYAKYDWSTAIESNFVEAQKLQTQWALLKDQRAAKINEFTAKQQQWEKTQQEAGEKVLLAEHTALIAKLPAWRNSETAAAEKQAIGKMLRSIGYADSELALLTDHRAMLIARDAMKYRELQKAQKERTKQVRAAPPVNTPGASGQQPDGKAGFTKFRETFAKQGKSGNHRAQETALQNLLGRTFK